MKFKISIVILIIIIALFLIDIDYTTEQEYLPALIIMYDDGHKEDITKAFPIHQKHNVPAVSAVNSETIGNSNVLNQEDLIKLEENGWEIASHGKRHTALIYNSLIKDLKKEDNKIFVNNNYLIERNYDYYIYNYKEDYGEEIKFERLITKDNERYFKLTDRAKNNYSVGNSYIVLSQESKKEEIISSKKELKEIGLEVNNFVYPYNGVTNSAQNTVKEHYSFARGGRRAGEKFPDCFINEIPLLTHAIKGVSFEKQQLRKVHIDTLLLETKKKKGLLVFYAHTANDGFSTERLEYIIKKAKDLNYNITTFNKLMGK
ncbi:MAG: polysaccharide deacetylase family protein [Bacillota bacterium]